MDATTRQSIVDAEHVRLLAFGYCISAATTAFWSLFGLMYAVMGLSIESIIRSAPASTGPPPPEGFGWILAAFGGVFFVVLAGFAAIKLYAARCLWRRERRVACFVVAAVSCIGIPYGTALGICTFVVLARPSVAQMFDTVTASLSD